jgi:pimeloyl-ACP methyl ester carboxylesterase
MLQRVVLDNARTLPLNFGEHAPNQPVVDCDYINTLKVPGLILYGEHTNYPWQADGESIAVTNANHDGPLSQPQQVADLIDQFIQNVELSNRTAQTR